MDSRVTHAYALLNGLQARGIHYDLDKIDAALARRGRPERRFRSVIVAGTNGKGSTSLMLHTMLRRLGFRTGLYSSPHLVDVRERMRIDELIPAATLAEYILEYERAGILSELTYYEALTLAAFDWFAASGVEWAVLEVGVGGRLDAVNLAPAEGAVIVSVDFDHRELLGDTIAKIAAEKAGVIKAGKPVVAGELPAEALEVVERTAREKGAVLFQAGVAFTVATSGRGFIYEGMGALVVTELGLPGAYQGKNLGCAVAALERIVGVDPGSCGDALRQALRDARWPGRFQRVSEKPLVVVDAAHNPAGARAVTDAFRTAYPGVRPTLVFASMVDKDHNASLAVLRALGGDIWLTDIPGQARAAAKEKLTFDAALTGAVVEIVPADELAGRIRSAPAGAAFLVTGSVAFAGWFLDQVRSSKFEV